MPSVLHNLDRESILLLYLAGELPEEDQAEVEQMLANDASLRAAYERLRATQDAIQTVFRSVDTREPLPAPASSSVRQVSVAIRQWHVNQLAARRRSTPAANGQRFGWLYTAAAVAATIVICIFVLWSRVDDSKRHLATNGNEIYVHDAEQEEPVDSTPTTAMSEPALVEQDLDDADFGPYLSHDEIHEQLNDAESELLAISTLTNSLHPPEEAVTP